MSRSVHFQRQVSKQLEKWKNKDDRKPLILRGARQVGKTTLIKDFSQNYRHQIILNLERPKDLRYFQEFTDVRTILDALFLSANIPSAERSETLLFIDEIQESPEAIALLRYFYEDIPELPVIAAGSLLEHAMRKVKNFPVGRVEFLYLSPLNFQEYLKATGQTAALEALLQTPTPDHAHLTLKDLFHQYAIIGGMPEVVREHIKTKSLADLTSIYEGIWTAYRDDVEKYARNASEAKIIRHIMRTAALQLDKRVTYQNFGNSNYRSREVGEALRNLHDARIVQLIHPTTTTDPPIIPDLKKSPRLQILDTGLVNHDLKIQGEMLTLNDLNHAFKGALIPHLITQELISLQATQYHLPNFWVREKAQSSAEVDLVIQHHGRIIPIEIKSGKTGSLKSLHQFIERCDHPYAVRMYAGKFSIEEHVTPILKKPYFLMNLPYYLSSTLPHYLDYFTKLIPPS